MGKIRRSRAALHLLLAASVAVGGCATRAVDVEPTPADPVQFRGWRCAQIVEEIDLVQQRAADVAWVVDQRAGQHMVALGVGLSIFWPALLAMRPDGADAEELARLKGRFEALHLAARFKGCPPPPDAPSGARAALMPVLPGERLVYEDRSGQREPLSDRELLITTLRRDEIELRQDVDGGQAVWRQDLAGNLTQAPPGALVWQRLLKRDLVLGQVLAGEMSIVALPLPRARVRGQVVALGPQDIGGRRFDAAVIEIFGEVTQSDSASTRLDGVMVVDRHSGVLLRLDLRSAQAPFALQRRLVRVKPVD